MRLPRTFVTLVFGLAVLAGRPALAAEEISHCTGTLAPLSPLRAISDLLESAKTLKPGVSTVTECRRHATRNGRRTIAVPPSNQVMGTCALHALRMVAMHWNAQDPSNAAFEVGDAGASTAESALGVAMANGWGNENGIAMAQLAPLARHYGYDAVALRESSIDDLKTAIESGTPPIIHFYIDGETGGPGTELVEAPVNGKSEVVPNWHAAVIEGFCRDRWGNEYVIARHAWRNDPYLWKRADFEKSWALADREMVIVRPLNKT